MGIIKHWKAIYRDVFHYNCKTKEDVEIEFRKEHPKAQLIGIIED